MPVNLEIEIHLQKWLRSQSRVYALIGNRIFPDSPPQNTILPYIVYTRISGNRWRVLRSAINVAQARIQLDCFGATSKEAKSLGCVIQDVIETFFRGEMDEIFVQSIYVSDIRDDSFKPIDASDRMEYKRSLDVIIHWELEKE